MRNALNKYGFTSELLAVEGLDIFNIIATISERKPVLVFNLCESLNEDVRNEIIIPALLNMLHIPYTGWPLSLGMCLYKQRAKALNQGYGSTLSRRLGVIRFLNKMSRGCGKL